MSESGQNSYRKNDYIVDCLDLVESLLPHSPISLSENGL